MGTTKENKNQKKLKQHDHVINNQNDDDYLANIDSKDDE
jgi:hypothetical protein